MARRQRFNICVGTEPTQDRIECLSAQKEHAYRVRVRLVRVIKVADHGRKKNAKSELKIPFTGQAHDHEVRPELPISSGQHDGFTTISEEAFLRSFANGVDHTKAEVLYAVQEPTAASLFGERTTVAAWHSKPSWYAVSKLDQTINPDLERFLAKRMNATTVELNAGHLCLVSHPKEIADLILAAASRRE
jgi:pimeloyl-ACP methyl ester carboxylesterase